MGVALANVRTVANASRAWSGDLSDCSCAAGRIGAIPDAPDGGENEEGFLLSISTSFLRKKRSPLSLHPALPRTIVRCRPHAEAQRADRTMAARHPALYKAGDPRRRLPVYSLKFLEELPPFSAQGARGRADLGLTAALPRWAYEISSLGKSRPAWLSAAPRRRPPSPRNRAHPVVRPSPEAGRREEDGGRVSEALSIWRSMLGSV